MGEGEGATVEQGRCSGDQKSQVSTIDCRGISGWAPKPPKRVACVLCVRLSSSTGRFSGRAESLHRGPFTVVKGMRVDLQQHVWRVSTHRRDGDRIEAESDELRHEGMPQDMRRHPAKSMASREDPEAVTEVVGIEHRAILAAFESAVTQLGTSVDSLRTRIESLETSRSSVLAWIDEMDLAFDVLLDRVGVVESNQAVQDSAIAELRAGQNGMVPAERTPYSVAIGGSIASTTTPYINTWESTATPIGKWTVIKNVGVSTVFTNYSGNGAADLRILVLDASGTPIIELPHRIPGGTTSSRSSRAVRHSHSTGWSSAGGVNTQW